MSHGWVTVFTAFDAGLLFYFLAINLVYLALAFVAGWALFHDRRRWTSQRLDVVMRSPATPAVSVIVPAHNEAVTIAESLRGLLLLTHPKFEIIVVNDGSTDTTLQTIVEAFDLLPAPIAHQQALSTAALAGVHRSPDYPTLIVIDKDNGGKADAINAGINAAQSPLICVIDADSILEPLALLRASLPFIEDPTTVATGGLVRVVNGCRVEAGRVVEVGLPTGWLARFQVIEYMRAFLSGRVALSRINGLLIISGAFGMFRRDIVQEIGGFRQDTIGEDMEIVARLHRHCRDQRREYRIVFLPDPVCWTEVPETSVILRNQRNRWQRGTWQTLSFHRGMIGNPRYGTVGTVGFPYYVIFEACGPVIEVLGYTITLLAVWFGVLDWVFAQLLFLLAVVFGTMISLLAVALEELAFRRHPKTKDMLWLVALAVLENLGYRQITAWWRFVGTIDFLRRRQGWGAMTRKGFEPPADPS